jgi:uncharacterized protein (TIGR02266 family)
MQTFGMREVEADRVASATDREMNRPASTGRERDGAAWRKILLAEDIDLFLYLEEAFFACKPVDLMVARTGRKVLEMAAAERPDLVLLGLDLPEMAGDECCRRLKETPALQSIPVILIAPYDQPAALMRCRKSGCDDVVTKPVNRHLFLQSVGRFLKIAARTPPRTRARLRVHYGTGTQRLLVDYSVNLSTGGVFIESSDVLPVETPLSLEFSLPEGQKTIRCRGLVAWVNTADRPVSSRLPPGMGVQFLDLSLDDLRTLREFINKESLHPSW